MTTTMGEYEWVFDWVEFGIAMDVAMNKRGMTLEALSGMALLSISRVGDLQNGEKSEVVKTSTLMSICNVLDLDPRDFFSIQKKG